MKLIFSVFIYFFFITFTKSGTSSGGNKNNPLLVMVSLMLDIIQYQAGTLGGGNSANYNCNSLHLSTNHFK